MLIGIAAGVFQDLTDAAAHHNYDDNKDSMSEVLTDPEQFADRAVP
jgi:hypothetical protein